MSRGSTRPVSRRQRVARLGEDAAAHYLEAQGYQIEARNVRFRYGEIDLVARATPGETPTRVFVEVKTRATDTYGPPQNAVGGRKQARLRVLAETYIASRHLPECRCRFDVIAVRLDASTPADSPHIEHLVDAF